MNEKKKCIVIYVLVFVFCTIICTTVCYIITRRADTQIDSIATELEHTRNRLAECSTELDTCRATVGNCKQSITNISTRINEQSGELGEIIANLYIVREEIENMENCINSYYNINTNSNNSINLEVVGSNNYDN